MGIIISLLSMGFYVTETALQLNDAFTIAHFWTFVVIIGLILGPLVITNVVSAIFVLRTMDFSGKFCGKLICVLLHFCQFGLFWRFSKLFILYDENDWKEFMTLRAIHTALQSIPYLIVKGFYMLQYNDVSAASFSSVIITLMSASVVLPMFNVGDVLFESDEFLDSKARAKKPIGIIFVIIGTLLILLARCGTFALMTYSMTYWIAIPLGVHYLLYFLSSTVYLRCDNKFTWRHFFTNIAVSYLTIFDVIVSEFRRIRCKYVLYYSAVLVENILMTAVWMVMSNQDYVLKLITVVVLLSSFVFGGILKCCSCGYVQEDTSDPSADDSLNIADHLKKESIARANANSLTSQNMHDTLQQNHNGDTVLPNQITAEIQIETIFKPETEINGIKVKTKPGKAKSKSSKESGSTSRIDGPLTSPNNKRFNSKDRYNMRLQNGESNADLASSNSRNTNTLNISNHSNHLHTIEDHELTSFNEKAKASPHVNDLGDPYNINRPVLGVRSSSRLKVDANNLLQSPQVKKAAKGKNIHIPLFPNECNSLLESKAFGSPKAKHILSNSVAEYRMDDTISETSYSEYLSYSYYIDSTDWSSMSCDSDIASTWPPSNPVTFVNLHNLPKEKVSITDSIRLWLSKLDETFESQSSDWQNHVASENISKSLQNLHDEEKRSDVVRRSSSIHGQRPNLSSHENQSVPYKKDTKVPIYTAQRPNVSLPENQTIPYNKYTKVPKNSAQNTTVLSNNTPSTNYNDMVSIEYDYNENVPRDFTTFHDDTNNTMNHVMMWHSDETSTPDVVQESVV